ncbi:hypothetical protein B0T17DRAFT_484942 [Bombardia bombarda]|uniref:Sister chromatid cohesion protein DCC1 n=1 Tax=Bombardia bombarda TaxID=252184 RepID=A0AA40CGQ9_9PEZI|nr:hypothetical protein B0T17DRAFT_484942 [Bombardia bombarda]
MTSPANAGIPLSHAPDHVGYKLLELPPELVELLEGENPPVLTLQPSPTAALLKTPNKTYSLRQKNTSNALMLLSTAQMRSPDAGPTQDQQTGSSPGEPATGTVCGLRAIATVHETIDLVPETEEAAAPAAVARGKWHEKFARTR